MTSLCAGRVSPGVGSVSKTGGALSDWPATGRSSSTVGHRLQPMCSRGGTREAGGRIRQTGMLTRTAGFAGAMKAAALGVLQGNPAALAHDGSGCKILLCRCYWHAEMPDDVHGSLMMPGK